MIIRSGEAKALAAILADAEGAAQNLSGWSFSLVIRPTDGTEPLPLILPVDGLIAPDGLSVSFLISGDQASAIYEAGLRQRLSYDLVQQAPAGPLTRWTERVAVQAGPNLPTETTPVLVELPVSQIIVSPDRIVVSERGARGRSWAEQLFEAGIITEPSAAAVENHYAALAYALEERVGNAEVLATTLREVGVRGWPGAVSSFQLRKALQVDGSYQSVIDALSFDRTTDAAILFEAGEATELGDVLSIAVKAATGKSDLQMNSLYAAAAAIAS
ncbi:hypothetical protein [Sphingobium sp. B2]|uniref:hypothetical protein n=1 Tax=Sphingobium sp. B2 TaxID=2583228 RepID=UPI00119F4AA9|nr:hypothetical protein [Sphingobium sp. B2]